MSVDVPIRKIKDDDNIIDFEPHRRTLHGMLKNSEAGFCVVMNTDHSVTGYWSFDNLTAVGKMQMLGRLEIMKQHLAMAYIEEEMLDADDEEVAPV